MNQPIIIVKHLIGYIYAKNGIFTLTTVSILTNKQCDRIGNFDFNGFPDSLPAKIKSSLKCFILKINDFTSDGFCENLIYRQNLDVKLKNLGIPYYFIDNTVLAYTSPMVVAEVNAKTNETVVIINIVNETHLLIRKFIRKDYGYEFIGNATKISYEINKDYDKIVNAVIDSAANPPIHIIGLLTSMTPNALIIIYMMQEQIFKEYMFTYMRAPFAFHFSDVMINIGKFFCDPLKGNRYHIKPKSQRAILVKVKPFENSQANTVMIIQANQNLPFQKSGILPRTSKTFYVYCAAQQTTKENDKLITQIKFCKNCHQIKFTLKIDINHVVSIHHEPIILDEIKTLEKDLIKLVPSKIPVIILLRNISIIYVWNSEIQNYEYLKSWNGIYGKEIFLSFKEEKPKIVDDSDVNEHVVYDLLEILAKPQNNFVVSNPECKFKIIKNSDNTALVEIKDHEGNRKAASPAFMMALILKEHIKVIKSETALKPKEVGFKFFGRNGFTKKERRRIRSGLEEACKKLNIVCFSFH